MGNDEQVMFDSYCARCQTDMGMVSCCMSQISHFQGQLCERCKSAELSFAAALDSRMDAIVEKVAARLEHK